MIFDKQGLFSNKQTVAALDLSEQTVDLYKGDIVSTPRVGDTPRDMGKGNPLPIRIQRTAAGAAPLSVDIISGNAIDGNNDITDGTIVGTFKIDELPAGSYGDFQFMPVSENYGRYLQLVYSAAATVTAGFVSGSDQVDT